MANKLNMEFKGKKEMKDQHKNPTISFRISAKEKAELEVRILASGMRKQDNIVRACMYSRVCVVGKKETIYVLVEHVQDMQRSVEGIATKLETNQLEMTTTELSELQIAYMNMLKAILWLLDGAKYLWLDK